VREARSSALFSQKNNRPFSGGGGREHHRTQLYCQNSCVDRSLALLLLWRERQMMGKRSCLPWRNYNRSFRLEKGVILSGHRNGISWFLQARRHNESTCSKHFHSILRLALVSSLGENQHCYLLRPSNHHYHQQPLPLPISLDVCKKALPLHHLMESFVPEKRYFLPITNW